MNVIATMEDASIFVRIPLVAINVLVMLDTPSILTIKLAHVREYSK